MLKAVLNRVMRRPRVCIIGAGVSGLRAAELLSENGAQVTILEARERFGGRLAQSDHLGHTVDLGPNWIHGTTDNPIIGLAKETGSILHSWEEGQLMFDASGEALKKDETAVLQETYWSIVGDAFKFSQDKQTAIEPGESLMDYFKQQTPLKFADRAKAQAQRSRDLLLQTAEMWGAFVGSATHRQSLKFFWLEQLVDEENPFVADTYSKILARIAAPVVAKVDLQLKQEVQSVSNLDDQKVQVLVQGKAPEAFDEVVVTVPLGCLKEGHVAFTPSLPQRLQQSIDSVGYGCLDKVYITFPSAFWQPSSTSAGSPGFFQWLCPSYDETNNPMHWGLECMNLAALPPAAAKPTLLFYIHSACAHHIAKLATTTPRSKADEALLNFFKPYFSRLPGYSPDDPACIPSAVLATAWTNDRYAGYGSYSNFQVGIERADEDIETMRQGLPERHIWFAGEHTAPFVSLGTVTGAYVSGESVAKRIIDTWGLDSERSQVA